MLEQELIFVGTNSAPAQRPGVEGGGAVEAGEADRVGREGVAEDKVVTVVKKENPPVAGADADALMGVVEVAEGDGAIGGEGEGWAGGVMKAAGKEEEEGELRGKAVWGGHSGGERSSPTPAHTTEGGVGGSGGQVLGSDGDEDVDCKARPTAIGYPSSLWIRTLHLSRLLTN